jgi:hypothetical protein
MSNAVRYPVTDLSGELVWADKLACDGTRPSGQRCAACGTAVTLKAGQHSRPHFAHESAVACTGGETALHATTFRVLRDGVLAAAKAQRSFPLALPCGICMAEREADPARMAHDCRVDQSLQRGDTTRPADAVRRLPLYVKWSHSQAAGGSYLMPTCFDCCAASKAAGVERCADKHATTSAGSS